nr:ribonuclease H-like domain-containing protein [Tanacetum cinerariifolium]
MVPAAVLTQSKPVTITAVRPICVAVPKIMMTRLRYAHSIFIKSKSPIRRHITRIPSPKTSNSPPRVTAAQALVVSAAKGKKGKWGNPQYTLKDKGVIDSGCLQHMTWNMSYLFDFEELNGGYVAFGGNPKGGKISGKGNIKTDSLLPISFWVEAVNTTFYVQNRVLVTKPHNKTPYELLHGRTPSIGFMRPFGCPVTILNTLDPLGKFEGKVDEGFLVGYSVNSKAFRVFNSRTCIVQETLHVNFLKNKPNIAGFQDEFDAEKAREEVTQQYVLFPMWSSGFTNPQNNDEDAAFDEKEHDAIKPESEVNVSPSSSAQLGKQDDKTKKKAKGKNFDESFTRDRDISAEFKDYFENSSNEVNASGSIVSTAGQNFSNNTNPFSAAGPSNTTASPIHGKSSFKDTSQLPDNPDMLKIEDITYSDHENVGVEADFNNLETSITVSPIPTTRTHKDHLVSQIIGDLSSTTQTKSISRVIKDQVDLPHGKREIGTKWVYRNKNDERGIVVRNKAKLVTQRHTQEEGIDYEEVFAPVARIEAIRLFLAYASFMGFMVYQMDVKSAFLYGTIKEEVLLELGKSASTFIDTEKPLLKDHDGEDVDVHIYRLMIGSLMYLTSSRQDIMFEVCACAHFQVTLKASHLHAVKRIFRYLKGKPHLGSGYPKDSPFDLVAYSDCDYIGASLDRKSITEGCQFLGCRLISWQCKKQTVVATSSTDAEYVAAANCYAQVLWIQNQLLDYGLTMQVVLSSIESLKMMLHVTNLLSAGYLTTQQMFWNTVTAKQSNDVTRLQALVDRKKVVLTETVIRDVLCLDDAEGVDCLPNEEIFPGLARMGYEKPSTKLTFYKAFFSSQWNSAMASAVICLSTGRKFNFSKYMFEILVRNVDNSSKFYMYPRFIQLTIQNQLDEEVQGNDNNVAQGVDTDVLGDDVHDQSIPLSAPPTPPPQPPQDIPSTSQYLEITKLKTKVKKLERANKVKALKLRRLKKVRTSRRIKSSNDIDIEDASNQGRMIAELDRDEGIALMDDEGAKKKSEDAQVAGDEQVKGRQAEIYQIDMDHAAKVLSMQKDEPKVQEAVEVVTIAKLITEVVATISESVSAASATIAAVSAATITAALVRRYQVMKKRPQTKAQARRIMIKYLKNTVRFRLDHFKGMSYDDIRLIFKAKFNSNIKFLLKSKKQIEEKENRALESINETLAQKAAKRMKLNEEVKDVEEIKQHLEIMPDEDDDVHTKATPLARKVPVVDDQIIQLKNKPR